jgi:hypothetical protein
MGRSEPVPQLAQRGLGRSLRGMDDLGAEGDGAVVGVGVRLRAAETVVDMNGPDGVPELSQHVPEAGRVGSARDEARHLASFGDEALRPDVRLDTCRHVHAGQCACTYFVRRSWETSATWLAGGGVASTCSP